MKPFALPLSLLIVFSLCVASQARIRNVPQDFETIQGAIDSARVRDTILVQPGVYEENVVIRRELTLASLIVLDGDESRIQSTIIDGCHNNPAVAVESVGDPTVVVKGFTLRNGRGRSGRGGGGVFSINSNLILDHLDVRDNTDGEGDGGGDAGGGILFMGDGDPVTNRITMRNVVVRHNTVENWGAVSIWFAHAVLTDVIIDSNASNRSGGLHFARGTLAMDRVAITNNYGPRTSALTMDFDGPAEREGLELICENVTVAGNTGGRTAVYCMLIDSDAKLVNCLFYDNSSDWYYFTAGRLEVDYSLFPGGRDEFLSFRSEGETDWGDGNLDADPRFIDPDNGNYHLTSNSPCIDAGDPDSPRDPDGTRADMGAFYFQHNAPPEVARQIADVVVAEDCGQVAIADLDTIFSDPNGDTLSYQVIGLEQLGLLVNDEHVLSIEPALNFNGDSLTVIISAHDAGDSASVSFLVTVTPVNDPPSDFVLFTPEDNSMTFFNAITKFFWQPSFDMEGNEVRQYKFFIRAEGYPYHPLTLMVDIDSLDLVIGWNGGCVAIPCLWWVEAISGEDTIECTTRFRLHVQGSGSVGLENGLPAVFAIQSVSPNPFNSSITIRFSLPSASTSASASLRIYGLDGRLMDEMDLGRLEAGEHSVVWNAGGLPAGVYLLSLQSGRETAMQKVVLLR